jgi:hypothetical protein
MAAEPPRDTARHLIAATLLGTLLCIAMHRLAALPMGNLHDGLPAAWQALGIASYGDDHLVRAATGQPTLWWLAIASAYRDVATSAWVLRAVPAAAHAMFMAGMGYLALSLGGGTRGIWLAVLMAAGLGEPLAGANALLSAQPSPGPFAAGPLLSALGLAFRGRPVRAFLLCGAMAFVHLLNAAFVAAFVAAITLAAHRAWLRARALRLGASLVPLAGALAWGALWGERTALPVGWADAVRAGHSIHYFLLSQPMELHLRLALVLLALGGAARAWRGELPRQAAALAACAAVWAAAALAGGVVGADLLGLRSAIMLQPLRMTAWLMPLACAALAAALARGTFRGGHALAALAVAAALGYLNLLRPFGTPSGPVIAGAGIVLAAALWLPRVPAPRVVAGAALAFPLVALASVPVLFSETFAGIYARLTLPGVWLASACVGTAVAVPALRSRLEEARGAACLLAASTLLFTGAVLVSRAASGEGILRAADDPELIEASAFMQRSLPPRAVVQGDPYRDGLRTWSRRAVFFESADDGGLYFRPSLLPELHRRARIVGVPLVKSYGARPPWQPTPRTWPALRAEGVTHLFLSAEAPPVPGTRRVFANARYVVLEFV